MNLSTLSRLKTQLDCLPEALGSASVEVLLRRSLPGKWSAHENLAHLVRHHEVMLQRIQRILSEDPPKLDRYSAEEDPDWPACAALSPGIAIERLRVSRERLIATIERLTPDQMARTGIHSRMGPLSLSAWLEFFLLHEAHHLYLVFLRVRGA